MRREYSRRRSSGAARLYAHQGKYSALAAAPSSLCRLIPAFIFIDKSDILRMRRRWPSLWRCARRSFQHSTPARRSPPPQNAATRPRSRRAASRRADNYFDATGSALSRLREEVENFATHGVSSLPAAYLAMASADGPRSRRISRTAPMGARSFLRSHSAHTRCWRRAAARYAISGGFNFHLRMNAFAHFEHGRCFIAPASRILACALCRSCRFAGNGRPPQRARFSISIQLPADTLLSAAVHTQFYRYVGFSFARTVLLHSPPCLAAVSGFRLAFRRSPHENESPMAESIWPYFIVGVRFRNRFVIRDLSNLISPLK